MREITTSTVAVEQDTDKAETLERWRKRTAVLAQAVEAGDVEGLKGLDLLAEEGGALEADLDDAAAWGLTLRELIEGSLDAGNATIATLMRECFERRVSLARWTISRLERVDRGVVAQAWRADYAVNPGDPIGWVEVDEHGNCDSREAPPHGVLLRDMRAALAEVQS